MIDSLEVWKTTSVSQNYEVSSLGRVRSLNRVRRIVRKNGSEHYQTFYGRDIKPQRNHDGYLMLRVDGKAISIHRLVALAFCEGWQEGLHVNHKNGLKDDNRPENLEWVTNAENAAHAFRSLGRVPSALGKLNGTHPSCKSVVRTCLRTGEQKCYPSMTAAAQDGFLIGSVSHCCLGRTKTHRGYAWAYGQESNQ